MSGEDQNKAGAGQLLKDDLSATLKALSFTPFTFEAIACKKGQQRVDLRLDVAEGARARVVFFDLLDHDLDFDLKVFAGARSEVEIYLAVRSQGDDRKHFRIDIVNDGVDGKSFVKMYGLATDRAHLDFLGSTRITPGSKKCRVRQEGRIINFDPTVKTSVSPELLIGENDVEASHGAVVGTIPTETLFYLTSRGVSRRQIEELLARSAFSPLLEQLTSEEIRARVLEELDGGKER